MTDPRPLSIVIVDDHEVVREGLSALLDRRPNFQVVAEAGTVAEAMEVTRRFRPDLVVMDVRLPDGSGIEACRDIRAELPETRVVMLTSYPDEEAVLAAIVAGGLFEARRLPADGVRLEAGDGGGGAGQVGDPALWRLLLGNTYLAVLWLPLRLDIARAEPRAPPAAQAPVHAVAVHHRPRAPLAARHALREHREHLIERRAREIPVGRGAPHQIEHLVLAAILPGRDGHDLLRQDVERRVAQRDRVEHAPPRRAHDRRALDELIAREREEPPLRRAAHHVPRPPDALERPVLGDPLIPLIPVLPGPPAGR